MIDPQQLSAIAEGAPELILEILNDFHQEASQRLEQLSDSLSKNQTLTTTDLLHQLSGSSGTLGLTDFHQKTKNLEEESKSASPLEIDTRSLQELLRASVEQARKFLHSVN